VRIYAWISILGNEGFLNDFLRALGLGNGIQFLYNQGAVILVLVYMYLPYAILPIFTAMDKFDFSLLEAARDLGATLCLGSDAHISYSLGDFSIASALVEEVGFPQERLLNTSPRRLLDFLESRGHTPIPEFADFT